MDGSASARAAEDGHRADHRPTLETLRRRAVVESAPRPANEPDGLPESLRSSLEALAAVQMDGVRVHRDSSRPARLGALAYTEGSDIYLGPGQAAHLPHEAWHVVQQRQGRVRPTGRTGGRLLNDDAGLEAEADDMGRRAGTEPAGPAGRPTSTPSPSRTPVVQRMIAGLEWVQQDDDVPDAWVDAYLGDVTHPHAHLYAADIVKYLIDVGLGNVLPTVEFRNDTGRHWDLKLLHRKPDGGPFLVQTMADGSCGAYLIHAIVNRDSIAGDVVRYTAPDIYVRKVRQAIQALISIDRKEIRGRIRDEVVKRTNVVETGFGPGLQRELTRSIQQSARRRGPTAKKVAPTAVLAGSPQPATTSRPTGRPRKIVDAGADPTPSAGARPSANVGPEPRTRTGDAPVIDNVADLRNLMSTRPATSSEGSDVARLVADIDDLNTHVEVANAALDTLERIWTEKGSQSAPTKEALTAALKAVQFLDQLVYGRIDDWSNWVATDAWVAGALGYLKQLSRLVIGAAQLINQRFDEVHRRTRLGPGGAPELVKEAALVKAAEYEAKFGKHAPALQKAIRESTETGGKKTAEPLSMARAVQSGAFKDMRFLPKEEAPADIDFTSTSKVQGYNNWDQKSMYVDAADWTGRIPHTHAKTHRGQRTGILLDTTYATEKDYARAWMELNRMTVEATDLEDGTKVVVDPKAYFEVRASDPTVYERESSFDAALGRATDGVGNNLSLFRSRIGADAFAAQRCPDVFGLTQQIDTLIAMSVVRSYADHRNALPAGNYMEFDQGIDLGMQAIQYASVRVVREHESGRLYLTLSHYKPFTWYDEMGKQHQGRPFFEVVTDGSTTVPSSRPATGSSAPSKEEKTARPAVPTGTPTDTKGKKAAAKKTNKSKK